MSCRALGVVSAPYALRPRDSAAPPSTPRDRGAGEPEQTRSTKRARALSGVSVLVIDDDTDGRELVATILMMEGATVDSADCAMSGYAAFERFRPSIIISDIAMPGEDGYSLMRRIRAAASAGDATPAIALSAFTREEDRANALRAGFTLHMGKPVWPCDLIAVVSRLAKPPITGSLR